MKKNNDLIMIKILFLKNKKNIHYVKYYRNLLGSKKKCLAGTCTLLFASTPDPPDKLPIGASLNYYLSAET